ncbi:MAG: RNA methyltransferase [Muribaculaceae bacterium]|nr:RNA methyltransferase [Muribaculaceae bacterium]
MELSKNKLSSYSGLGSRKQRLKKGLFIVEGEKSVADTLGSFRLEALVTRTGFVPSMFEISRLPGDRIFSTDDRGMDKLSTLSTSSQVVAIYRLPEETLRKRGERKEIKLKECDGLYLMLDGIQDPGNLGTIIRTAHWFGIKKIFASPDTADIYNPKTIQATMGSLAKVEVEYVDLPGLLNSNPDMPVYGLLLDGEDIFRATLKDYGFIVMGNEGKGISEEVRRMVTDRLLIPPYDASNHSESLNVAIATGITLAAFRGR